MALYATDVEWHSLQIDPEDLPEEDEPILVTVESFMQRLVWLDAFIKKDKFGNAEFFTKVVGDDGKSIEDQEIWYKVVAWAYPPAPFNYF
jgi:hypothetical protein